MSSFIAKKLDDNLHPEGMSFARSDALFPPDKLSTAIGAEYEAQCRMLCYGPYPSWAEIQARLQEIKDLQ